MDRLTDALRRQLSDVMAALPNPVTLAVFTRPSDGAAGCDACRDTVELATEVEANSGGKVRVEVFDLDRDGHTARLYGVDMVPATVVLGGPDGRTDYGVRIFGAPDGYEFATLVQDILMTSRGATDLSAATRDVLAHLAFPLRIKVFVTPTCPYCPRAAVLAHSMSIASDLVSADVIDATEFPDLAAQYRVRGVPRTIVNESVHIEGAVPESMFLAQLIPLFEDTPGAAAS